MFGSLEKLQNKPESARRRFAFIVSLLVVLVIVFFWAASFSSRTKATVSPEPSSVTPLSSVFRGVEQAFSDVKKSLSGIEEYRSPSE